MVVSLAVLCFSRDRPLQLEAYLRGLFLYCHEAPAVTVLYRSAPQFAAAYLDVAKAYPQVRFESQRDFFAQVCREVEICASPFFMFGCDDVVIHEHWDVRDIARWMQIDSGLSGFSLRLGSGIRYCHPLQEWVAQPQFIGTNPLCWDWRGERGDWGVPFEMNATVCRIDWIRSVIEEVVRLDRRPPTPNFLESIGCKLARMMESTRGRPRLASYDSPVANCLAINRVQSDMLYPIYDELSPEDLLRRYQGGWRLDVERYQGRTYDRVHIGDAFFTREHQVRRR